MKMNMIQNEWMGTEVKVVAGANASLVGLSGIIVDESKELVTIQSGSRMKKVQKNSAVFTINNQTVEGSLVRVAPEARLGIKVV